MVFTSCFPSFTPGQTPFLYHNSDPQTTKIRQPSSHRPLLSRLLKSALFDSLMVKKIDTTSSQSSIDPDKRKPLLSIENTDGGNSGGTGCTDIEDSSRCPSNLLLSSSSSSTISISRRLFNQKSSPPIDPVDARRTITSDSSTMEKPNLIHSRSYHDQKDLHRLHSINSRNLVSIPVQKLNYDNFKSVGNNWNIRLCLFLLLSLVVLMVYGRMYSILCTSSWFYVLPRHQMKRVNSVSGAVQVSG